LSLLTGLAEAAEQQRAAQPSSCADNPPLAGDLPLASLIAAAVRETEERSSPKAPRQGLVLATAEVEVPHDAFPGDSFTIVMANRREVIITCPDDAAAGDVLELEIPEEDPGEHAWAATAESFTGEFETAEVAVPDECQPGDSFTVQASWGGLFEVEVPVGTHPGATLFIELPAKQGGVVGQPTKVRPQLNI
jgi:hypothetical protein